MKFKKQIKLKVSGFTDYLSSEQFIFDLIFIFFFILLDFIIPKSKDDIHKLLHNSPAIEFWFSLILQTFVSFGVGRFMQKTKGTSIASWLEFIAFGMGFFLFVFPAFFIEKDGDMNTYLVLGTIIGIFPIIFGTMIGANYEKKDFKSEKKTYKKVLNIFLISLSYTFLMLYGNLLFVELGMDNSSIISIILVMTISGILPYRILLILKPPVEIFGAIIGIVLLLISLFF